MLLGRLRQKDYLKIGIQGQPGQHNEIVSKNDLVGWRGEGSDSKSGVGHENMHFKQVRRMLIIQCPKFKNHGFREKQFGFSCD